MYEMPLQLSAYQMDKLGNTLIYLAKNVGDFNKTKALKLLFLLEEYSIKQLGVPFFGFDFKVWQFGPVVEEIYNDFHSEDIPMLNKYIKRARGNPEEFEPNAEFNDDEFSEDDKFIMEQVVKLARNKIASDLVRITHGKGSLWLQAVEKHNLKEGFDNKKITTTNFSIDFYSLFNDDEYLKEKYASSLDFLQFNNLVKH